MTDLRKAAEMALDYIRREGWTNPQGKEVWIALRQALAQPEQEPDTVMAKYEFQTYAAYKTDGEMKIGVVPEHTAWVTAGEHTVPLKVSAPVDAVNMSQERVDETVKRKHEPVAWSDVVSDGGLDPRNAFDTAPPKREWVGLTDEDKDELLNLDNWTDIVEAVEAKLKEKNT